MLSTGALPLSHIDDGPVQPIVSGVDPTHPDETVPGTRFRIRWLRQTVSTNTDAVDAAAAGEPEGLVIAADHQTAGRGRMGRTWAAPPGSALLTSFLLRPAVDRVHLAVTAVACAAAEACGRVAGVEPGLKWPNDLVTDTGEGTVKLAGVLAEAVTDGDRVTAVVVGLGLNVVRSADFPAELEGVATSLDRLSPKVVERHELLKVICAELETRCETMLERPDALIAEYRRRCVTIGQDVRIEQPGRTWEGRATDVGDDGSLEVRTASGLQRVEAGDVIHLRPA
ncbi:MAG: hypothetical protein NVSMB16_11760 [Acidimicrobiales bacterium]